MKHLSSQLPHTLFLVGFILVGVLITSEVKALSRETSFDSLIERSTLVITGTVVGKTMARERILVDIESLGADRKPSTRVETVNEVLTEYEIELTDVLRGCYKKSVIHVTIPGGVVGDREIATSNTFYMTKGKKYYLFLGYEQRNDKYWVVSSQQGAFQEIQAKDGVVVKSINRKTVLGTDGRFVSGSISSEKGSMKIEQFLSRVEESCHE